MSETLTSQQLLHNSYHLAIRSSLLAIQSTLSLQQTMLRSDDSAFADIKSAIASQNANLQRFTKIIAETFPKISSFKPPLPQPRSTPSAMAPARSPPTHPTPLYAATGSTTPAPSLTSAAAAAAAPSLCLPSFSNPPHLNSSVLPVDSCCSPSTPAVTLPKSPPLSSLTILKSPPPTLLKCSLPSNLSLAGPSSTIKSQTLIPQPEPELEPMTQNPNQIDTRSDHTIKIFIDMAEITHPNLFKDGKLIINDIQSSISHPFSCTTNRFTNQIRSSTVASQNNIQVFSWIESITAIKHGRIESLCANFMYEIEGKTLQYSEIDLGSYYLLKLDVPKYFHDSPFGLYGSAQTFKGEKYVSGFFWLNVVEIQLVFARGNEDEKQVFVFDPGGYTFAVKCFLTIWSRYGINSSPGSTNNNLLQHMQSGQLVKDSQALIGHDDNSRSSPVQSTDVVRTHNESKVNKDFNFYTRVKVNMIIKFDTEEETTIAPIDTSPTMDINRRLYDVGCIESDLDNHNSWKEDFCMKKKIVDAEVSVTKKPLVKVSTHAHISSLMKLTDALKANAPMKAGTITVFSPLQYSFRSFIIYKNLYSERGMVSYACKLYDDVSENYEHKLFDSMLEIAGKKIFGKVVFIYDPGGHAIDVNDGFDI